jgi:hypothetical protein
LGFKRVNCGFDIFYYPPDGIEGKLLDGYMMVADTWIGMNGFGKTRLKSLLTGTTKRFLP